MWYRVFGRSGDEVSPADLAAHLHAAGLPVEPHFKGDDLGWTAGELRLPGGAAVVLERYLAKEDDIRDELNAHAAELETGDSPAHVRLMAHVIQTQQLITVRTPAAAGGEAELDRLLLETCGFLSAHTDGVYQIDGRGWFAADGAPLVRES